MKMTARITAIVVALLLLTTQAKADALEPYVGLGLGAYTLGIDDTAGSNTDEAFGAYLSAGVDIAKYLGAEVRIGTTTSEASFPPAILSEYRAKYIISYLGKLQLPFDNGLRFYAIGGGTTTVVYFGSPYSKRRTLTGVSFGGGIDYRFSGLLFSDQYRIGVEAVRYMHNVGIGGLPNPPFADPATMTIDALVGTLRYEF